MTYDDILFAILSALFGAGILYVLAKHIRAARTGILPDRDGAISRSDDPRRFRLELWFDVTASLLVAIWIALVWSIPGDGPRHTWTSAFLLALLCLSLAKIRMTDPGARRLVRLTREDAAVACLVAATAIVGSVLIFQWLGL